MSIKSWFSGKLVERLASPSGAAGIVALVLVAVGEHVSPEMQGRITDCVSVIAGLWLCWVHESKVEPPAADDVARRAGLGS